jgi:hypothetical protein
MGIVGSLKAPHPPPDLPLERGGKYIDCGGSAIFGNAFACLDSH